MLLIVKKHLSMRENSIVLKRVCLVKYLLPAISPTDVFKKPLHFLTSDLMTKLIFSEITFMSSWCELVPYKVLKSKVEIDLDKNSTNHNFLQSKQKKFLL